MTYLTESRLSDILKEHVDDIVLDKSVPGAVNRRTRADIRMDSVKTIVEFDGYGHYTNAKRIISDRDKDSDYEALGYKVIRIPYFIQMDSDLLKYITGVDTHFDQVYPHGFIDKKATLPCDYCEMGIDKFLNDLERFPNHKDDIIKSLNDKIDELGDKRLVIPKSLVSIL